MLDGLVEQPAFLRLVVQGRQMLVDPAVNANLVAAARQNIPDHLGMQDVAHGGNEEGRGHIVFVQQAQDARQAIDSAVLALGKFVSAQLPAR